MIIFLRWRHSPMSRGCRLGVSISPVFHQFRVSVNSKINRNWGKINRLTGSAGQPVLFYLISLELVELQKSYTYQKNQHDKSFKMACLTFL